MNLGLRALLFGAIVAAITVTALVMPWKSTALANTESVSYINVYVSVTESTSDPDNIVTNFTITWFDADDCTTDYNAYLNIAAGNRPGQETPGSQHHLGSVASDGAQISNGLSGIQGALEGFNVELYCGSAESGRLVSRVLIPRGAGVSPFISTYSSEPPLSALNVSHGTLTPTFNSHTFNYTVSDIANADTRITIAATPKTGYFVRFYDASGDPARLPLALYSGSPSGPTSGLSEYCSRGVADEFGNLVELTDADPDTPGFQVDLYDGENHIDVWVYRTAFCEVPKGYLFAINRAEGSVSLVRPNRPATGWVSIDPDLGGLDKPTSPWPGLTLRTDTDHSNFRDRDGLTNPSYTYQWLADDAEIAGETSTEYRVKLADMGKTLKVRVSFTDDRGTEETRTSSATRAVKRRNHWPEGKPIIRGTLEVGQTLTADISGISDPNGMTNATFSYRWGATLSGSGSTDSEYTLVSRDEGTDSISLKVTYTDDDGHEETLYTERRGVVAPSPTKATGAPAITGVAQVGQTLAVDTSGIADGDGLANVSYRYRWVSHVSSWRGNTHPTGYIVWRSSDSTYTVVDADEGGTIKVRVSFTDDAGFEETLISAPTAAVVAATTPGAPRSVDVQPAGTGGLSLSWQEPASNGGSEISGYTVEWKKAADSWDTDEDVSEATARDTIHTITGLELDVEYTVRVIATNSVGDGPASDEVPATPVAQTSQQQAATQNTPATGQPAISGTLQVGETLTADTSPIGDADGVTNATFSYQWIRNNGRADVDIEGATGPSYALVSNDEGKTIKVRVSFTDDAGNSESMTSAATAAVLPNVSATGAPAIAGTLEVGETLTADTSGIADSDGLENVSYSYQWIRSDGTDDWDVEGATGSTYAVTAADVDKAIKLRVNFTDDKGSVESLTSSATAVVPVEVSFAFSIEGTTVTCDSYNVHIVNVPNKECDDPTFIDQGASEEIEVEIEVAKSVKSQLYKFRFRIYQMEDSIGHYKIVEANDLCLGPGLADSVSMEVTPDDGTGNFTYNDEGTMFNKCPAGTYQLYVPWYRYNYEDEEYEHAGTFRRYFIINGDDKEDTSIEQVKFITASYPDTPVSHDEVQIEGTKQSTMLNRTLTTFALSIDGLVPDSDTETTDYVVRVRVIGDGGPGKTVPWCHVGNVGYSYLLKTVPEDGRWAMEAHVLGGCLRHQWPDTLQVELFDGSDLTDYSEPIVFQGSHIVSNTGELQYPEYGTHEFIAGIDISLSALPNIPATGTPTISGAVQVGETLTADTSGITDVDGLDNVSFSYQWLSSRDTEISGATGSTYILASTDLAKTIKVKVTFTDDAGNEESVTKPIPRWDVHFGEIDDDRKDSTAPHITFGPQLGGHR